MDFLQLILEQSEIPPFTVLLLGLLTAISTCPLATNITAIDFICKDIGKPHRVFIYGTLYTLRRIMLTLYCELSCLSLQESTTHTKTTCKKNI